MPSTTERIKGKAKDMAQDIKDKFTPNMSTEATAAGSRRKTR